MQIIMDMDEVIVDFLDPLLVEYSKKVGFGGYLSRNDITQYYLTSTMREIFKKEGFFVALPPLPGAIEGMRKLKSSGHDVVVATSPSGLPHIALEKMVWFRIWLPEFVEHMHITDRKDRLIGDIIVDDAPHHLLSSTCAHKIVMDRRYNRHLEDMHRVCDWNGLLTTIDYLSINPRYRLEMGV